MECPSCKTKYDQEAHCPRLLVTCGHSVCETCLKTYFYDGAIVCYECRKLNRAANPNFFPKNLALVQAKPGSIQDGLDRFMTDTVVEIKRDPSIACPKHGKKIEGI